MSEVVFINYRREDAAAEAHLVAQALRKALGDDAVFMDASSTEFGATWPDRIRAALKASRYIITVIGTDWLRAGSNEWGQRRIDYDDDWVRQEIAAALKDETKIVIPVLVRGGQLPPSKVLPGDVAAIASRQAIELRRDYWDHDIQLLTAQIRSDQTEDPLSDASSPYPSNTPIGPDALADDKIDSILASDLDEWIRIVSPLPEDPSKVRVELFREYRFKSFQDAIGFMAQVAPGCDIADHHPRWENLWKTIRVYLTTWDIGHRISDRDVQLARYLERAFAEFPGAVKRRAP